MSIVNSILKAKYEKFKEFLHNNKREIIIGGFLLGALGVLGLDDNQQRKDKEVLTYENEALRNIVNTQNSKIGELEKKYLEKDSIFSRCIACGTRSGDSECARQMNYRRQYLNTFRDVSKKYVEKMTYFV